MVRNAGGVLRAHLVTTIILFVVLDCALGNPVPYNIYNKILPSSISILLLSISATTTISIATSSLSSTPVPPSPLYSTTSTSLQSENVFRFAHSIYNVSIPENSIGKTYAIQPANEDRLGINVTPDLDVKYRIVSGDKDKIFKAEERIVGDFAFLAIRTRTGNVVLNREKIDEYRLEIKAIGTLHRSNKNIGGDSNHNGFGEYTTNKILLETETEIMVKVLDTNDLSPLFYPTEYSVNVPEDLSLHKSIIKVTAEDADLGINGEIYYSFLRDTDYFGIHPTSGIITLTRALKFTDRSLHELIVVATDRGSSTNNNRLNQASTAKVHVKVKQVSLFMKYFCILLIITIFINIIHLKFL